MKALLLTAPGVLEYTDVPEPAMGDDDLLVRVEAVGICGSDVHGMDGSSGRRVPPLVMGHEAAGVVEAVGRSVTGWAVGDPVTFDSTVYCGRCAFCTAGLTNLCDDRRVLGVAQGEWRRDGAFAERVAVPARIAHRLPPGMSMVEAALTEPLTVALHAVSRAPVAGADSVLVIGAGLIGLLIDRRPARGRLRADHRRRPQPGPAGARDADGRDATSSRRAATTSAIDCWR